MKKPDEIYKEALVGISQNVKALASMIDEIEKNIDMLILKPIYAENEKNAAHLKTEVKAGMTNPGYAQQAGIEMRPFVDELRNIHNNLSGTYQKIKAMVFLQGREFVGNQKIKKAIESQLKELNAINEQFLLTSQLVKKHVMLLANQGHFADPGQKRKLDEQLKTVHQHVNELKKKTHRKHDLEDGITKPKKPGKM